MEEKRKGRGRGRRGGFGTIGRGRSEVESAGSGESEDLGFGGRDGLDGAGSGADVDGRRGELRIGGVERAVVEEMDGVGGEKQLRNLRE